MLRDSKTHVVQLVLFTIQLDYSSGETVQEVLFGVDAASKHIGISVSTEGRVLLAMKVEERDDIVDHMVNRRETRRTCRSRKLRHRPSRFIDRCRKEGWMTPSSEYRISAHLHMIRLECSILPITKTTIEVAQFVAHKINNDKISRIEYQKGEQFGFWNVREYVLARDGHVYQHCKGKPKDKILNVHHIKSRKTGGNVPNYLITLCETCHKAYRDWEMTLKPRRGSSLRDAAAMSIMRWEVYNRVKREIKNVYLTYGYNTKHTRIYDSIAKTHCADALCISDNVKAERLTRFYGIRLTRRHNRSLHFFKPKKGGIRQRNVASQWIGKSRLQQHDYVECNGQKVFTSGSQNGRP